MPETVNRESLSKDIESRYKTQSVGSTFDIKNALGDANTGVQAGKLIDASSTKGQEFQNKNGFETKVPLKESRFKVVQSGGTQGNSDNAPLIGFDKAGTITDAASSKGQEFQNKNGFETKVPLLESRLKVVQSGGTSGMSRFVKGLDTRRYK